MAEGHTASKNCVLLSKRDLRKTWNELLVVQFVDVKLLSFCKQRVLCGSRKKIYSGTMIRVKKYQPFALSLHEISASVMTTSFVLLLCFFYIDFTWNRQITQYLHTIYTAIYVKVSNPNLLDCWIIGGRFYAALAL